MAIGLDLGSSSVKAVRIGSAGRVIATSRRPLAARRGRGGRVEQDPKAILAAAEAALDAVGGASSEWLGIATQRSTVLFWERDSGRPLTPAYSWQDRRGEALCERLGSTASPAGSPRASDIGRWIQERTGLRLSPHYSASKLAWALRRVHGLRRKVAEGRALWGTLGTFLLWHMSAGSVYAIDHANAQRTLLLDLGTMDWDPSLLHLFGLEALLDAPALPELVPTFASSAIALDGVGRRLRLGTLTGDQQAAMLGLGCRRPGDVVINYGTGAFVLKYSGARRVDVPGLLTTLLATWPGAQARPAGRRAIPAAVHAVEGTVNAAATAIVWAQRRLGLRVPVKDLDTCLRREGARRRDVHFLPAVAGLGAPHWDASARPRFAGDLRGASTRDLLLAVVESIAFRCAEILRTAAGAAGRRMGERPIVAAGGLTCCRTLVQAQADLLQGPLLLRDSPEATALGAALLSRPARAGRIPRGVAGGSRLVRPRISRDEAEARFSAWARAVYGPEDRRATGPSGALSS